MAWFDGGIPEAITASRNESKLFLVYIKGDDEDSKQMNDLWQEDGVIELCKQKCVSIKLENESTAFKQFAEVYPVVIVPVTFLIGKDGIPVEIVAGSVSAREIKEKISNAFTKTFEGTGPTSQAKSPAQTIQSNAGFSDDETLLASGSTQPSASASGSEQSGDKKKEAERLQEKINQRRLQKAKDEEDRENQREIERRSMGKAIQQMRDQQKEIKMKKDLEERRKDKQKEKEALQKVREQIAKDREERKAKFAKEKQERLNEEEKMKQEQEAARRQRSEEQERERQKIARIQYRLPQGSAFTRHYPKETTLGDMIADLRSQPVELPRDFRLALRMPRRVFQPEDYSSTLAELDLVPSASLAVQPVSHAVQSRGGEPNFFQSAYDLLVFILSLPINILVGLWKAIFGGATATPQANTSTSPSPSARPAPSPMSDSYSSAARRRNVGAAASMETKQQGNMHRLSDVKRDDDDEATWNGNSTQQM